MKKLSILLPILFVVTLVFANTILSGIYSKAVTKQISLSLFTSNDYTAQVYDSSLAQVAVTVQKISGNSAVTVLTKTFDAQQLKKYAPAKNTAPEIFSIDGVKENREKILVTYTVTYNTKGSIMTFEKQEVLGKGIVARHIDVEI